MGKGKAYLQCNLMRHVRCIAFVMLATTLSRRNKNGLPTPSIQFHSRDNAKFVGRRIYLSTSNTTIFTFNFPLTGTTPCYFSFIPSFLYMENGGFSPSSCYVCEFLSIIFPYLALHRFQITKSF
jgi:hypothetical protein